MKEIYSSEEIQTSIRRQAMWFNRRINENETVWAIALLNGAFMYASDLTRGISNPCVVDFMRVRSYNEQSRGLITIESEPKNKILNAHILLLDDVWDSGETAKYITTYLSEKFNPKSFTIMTAFHKATKEKNYLRDNINPGLPVSAHDFIIGYGLDENEYRRNWSALYSLKK